MTSPQPETRGMNFFHADRSLRELLGLYLPADELQHLTPQFARLGDLVGGELDDLAHAADKNPPVLRHRDRQGRDIQHIDKHPAYVEMERLGYGEFALAAMSHRAVLGRPGPLHPVAKYAFQYLFAQSEFGLLCPISMTDSLTRTLVRYGDKALVDRYLPALTAGDLDTLAQGAMFMTEQAAGSDVGAATTTALRDGDAWRLYGDKWFCSNADADLALVLARPEGAETGTKGLGLFLMPRRLPDGKPNRYRIVRLKDKLGTRSMASGEITLEGAIAWLVGEPNRGFVQMAEMINQSRLSNGIRSAGMMRRAVHEALCVARGRRAFGRLVIELPLMRRQLLKLMLPTEQALSMCLFTAEALHRADAGEEEGRALRRILTPLLKFRICRDARKVAGDAMEVRGGCGYIEEWIEPRLLRDTHLGSIWEGTSNIVALDVLRAGHREGCHEALGAALKQRLSRSLGVPEAFRGRLVALLDRAVALAGEAAGGGADGDRLARQAASGLYNAASAVLLACEGDDLARRGGDAGRMLWAKLAADYRLSPRDPLEPFAPDEAEIGATLLADTPIAPGRAAELLGC